MRFFVVVARAGGVLFCLNKIDVCFCVVHYSTETQDPGLRGRICFPQRVAFISIGKAVTGLVATSCHWEGGKRQRSKSSFPLSQQLFALKNFKPTLKIRFLKNRNQEHFT